VETSPQRKDEAMPYYFVAYAITAFQDITERQQAEADKIRLAQEQEDKNVAVRYNQDVEAKNQELANTL
jgi:hypothetical protein